MKKSSSEKRAERAKRLRLNPYQRETKHVGRGLHHWHMSLGGKVGGFDAFVHKIFRAGARGSLSQFYTDDKLRKALSEARGEKLHAIVNHNRWIAICECGGAEVADPSDRRMYCFSCFNILNDGYTREVEFPRRWKAIEHRLKERPEPLNRNWILGETLKDLEAQNVAHGLSAGRNK